uniref:Uncharacterized protein n=1 Tax=Tanacetum cinerariifolium TaxID=118510 RepID=A0A6L2J789_TANCI|nr:hypothetical protein [Tanacetum cinerariifolium]
MAFGRNKRDLGSFGEETNEITKLHQILEEVLLTVHGDDVVGITRRHRDPSSNDVKDLVTASGCSRLNEDLESSTSDGIMITTRRRRELELSRLLNYGEGVTIEDGNYVEGPMMRDLIRLRFESSFIKVKSMRESYLR